MGRRDLYLRVKKEIKASQDPTYSCDDPTEKNYTEIDQVQSIINVHVRLGVKKNKN